MKISFAYNPLKHRHEPEIAEKLRLVSGHPFEVNFCTSFASSQSWNVGKFLAYKRNDVIDAKAVVKEFYKDTRFVRVRDVPADIKSTAGNKLL